MGTFVDSSSADELEKALHHDGPRVVVLETEDGPLHVVVSQLVYYKRASRVARVGFASG